MGGTNQATAPPPPASAKASSFKPGSFPSQSIRFHEDAGEAHFHDDATGLKCVVPYGEFKLAYETWRNVGDDTDLVMLGEDGKQGGAKATFTAYACQGKREIAIQVEKIAASSLPSGVTLTDLDKMAGY